MDAVCHCRNVPGRILHLGVAKQKHVRGVAEEIHSVCPHFLGIGEAVNPFAEEVSLCGPVVPTLLRRQHVDAFPEVYIGRERGIFALGIVHQHAGAHENRVCEHMHILPEGENLTMRVVVAYGALYQLSVLVAHGGAAAEYGDTVFGIVSKVVGAEDVAFLVLQLHPRALEDGEVGVDVVVQFLAGEDGLVLDYLYVAPAVDLLGGGVPEGGV